MMVQRIDIRCLRSFLVFLLLSWLSGCFASCEKPGQGAKAEAGYAVCEPVITALENYKQYHSEYPEQLLQLAPAFIAEIPPGPDSKPLIYRKTKDSYELEFRYTRPGMNHCVYKPEEGWDCYGYY